MRLISASFWSSRQAVTASTGLTAARRDAYSIIVFNDKPFVLAANDFTSSPDELLKLCLSSPASGSTNFPAAIDQAQSVMMDHVSLGSDSCRYQWN